MIERAVVSLRGAHLAAVMELRRFCRNRTAMVMTFVTPAVIASIVVFALGSSDTQPPPTLGWVSDGSPEAETVVDEVVHAADLDGVVAWTPLSSVDAAVDAVAAEELGAAIVIGAPRTPTEPAGLVVLGDEDPVASGVAATIADQYRVEHAAIRVAAANGLDLPDRGGVLDVEIVAPGGASLDPATYWGPALGSFLVLLAMGYAAQRQVVDRQRGIAARVRSTITPAGSVAAGRSIVAAALGTAALIVMAVVTGLLFGRLWAPWPLLLLVATATGVAVAGIGAVVAASCRTPGQAQSATAVVSFALAIGGGSFSPLGNAAVSGIARWTPTALSLDGFTFAATTRDVADLVVPVGALMATGCSLLLAGALVHGRRSA